MKIKIIEHSNSWDVCLVNYFNEEYFLRNFWKEFNTMDNVNEELKQLGNFFDLSSTEVIYEDRS